MSTSILVAVPFCRNCWLSRRAPEMVDVKMPMVKKSQNTTSKGIQRLIKTANFGQHKVTQSHPKLLFVLTNIWSLALLFAANFPRIEPKISKRRAQKLRSLRLLEQFAGRSRWIRQVFLGALNKDRLVLWKVPTLTPKNGWFLPYS